LTLIESDLFAALDTDNDSNVDGADFLAIVGVPLVPRIENNINSQHTVAEQNGARGFC